MTNSFWNVIKEQAPLVCKKAEKKCVHCAQSLAVAVAQYVYTLAQNLYLGAEVCVSAQETKTEC